MPTPHPSKPEWDTPPDGDFASYVERLSAAALDTRPAAAPRRTPGPGPRPPDAAARPQPAAGAAPHAPQAALPPDLAQVFMPLARGLAPLRAVLLALTVLHALALFVLGQGSLLALAAMAAAWWGLGRLASAAAHTRWQAPAPLARKAANRPSTSRKKTRP